MSHIGFIGTGKTPKSSATALLEDFFEKHPDPHIVIPMSKQHWSEGLAMVLDLALERQAEITVLVDDTPAKAYETFKTQVTTTKKVANIPQRLVAELGTEGSLVILWDDEDSSAMAALEGATESGVPAYDLTRGMDLLELGDEEDSMTETGPVAESLETDPDSVHDEEYVAAEYDAPADLEDVEYQPYTRDELEEMDLDAIKEILTASEIPIPGTRPRKTTLIDLILQAQEGEEVTEETDAAPVEAPAEVEATVADDEPTQVQDDTPRYPYDPAGIEIDLSTIEMSLAEMAKNIEEGHLLQTRAQAQTAKVLADGLAAVVKAIENLTTRMESIDAAIAEVTSTLGTVQENTTKNPPGRPRILARPARTQE